MGSNNGDTSESQPPIWDAADYAENSQGQYRWAMDNLGKLRLTGSETVLDVGCGDGKITIEIARRVPHGRVIGIDQSAEMIALAARAFELPNLGFRVLDAQALNFNEEFDAIFSNSAIHWMPEQSTVIRGIARALKPGGRVFLSMGGRGTAALPRKAIEELIVEPRWSAFLAEASSPHYFFGPAEYLPWLAAAGLHADRVELAHRPMRLANVQALEGWLRTTWMTYWQRLPLEERPDFLHEFTKRVRSGCEIADGGALLMPMVNLEIEAHK
jgi:trans-aconitate methyltransferase